MNQIRLVMIVVLFVHLLDCAGPPEASRVAGNIRLVVSADRDFRTDINHGEAGEYRITVSGDSLESPIVRSFAAGTEEAQFDDLPAGANLTVALEVINVNGIVVRRGTSDNVMIRGGQVTPVSLTLRPVPIFANVRDGARIPANRFVPRLFYPGAGQVILSDSSTAGTRSLRNSLTDELSFSLSENQALHPLYVGELAPGTHALEVRDAATGEASQVSVEILPPSERPVLPTSAGGYVGTLMSMTGTVSTNLPSVHNKIVLSND